ncbi:hypothetical protein AJ78_01615 [Emergomyces pasteurianus Ep9510]|uniref:Uncharacterized protein n=1 Tax=Emergomyces pasteurianus Ep9510 TaxID=1447872 RepID=A0A1J9QDS7_9EURO|nr:hypothetical protein AJ78_01615 [Emergomyces pasteurianus Ep9510]
MAEPEPVDTPTGFSESTEDGMMNRGLQMAALFHQLVQQGVPSELASNMAVISVMKKPSSPQTSSRSNDRVKEFRQQYGHVSLRIDTKLASQANYESWRRDVEARAALLRASHILSNYENSPPENADSEDCLIWQYKETKLWEAIWDSLKFDVKEIMQAKLRDADSGSNLMGKAAVLWRLLEDQYQMHYTDLQMQLIDRICKCSIDDHAGDIIAHTSAWQRTVADLRLYGWALPDMFLRQRFILSLGKYARSHVQRFLLELRKGKPKTHIPEFNVDDLISELVRQRLIVQPDVNQSY